MFITMRQYQVEPNAVAEITQKAKTGFAPLLKQAPGFQGYFLVESGPGHVTTISLFETRAQAEASTKQASEWVAKNLAALTPKPPTVTTGEAKVNELAPLRAVAR